MKHILVVDDEPSLVKALRLSFQQEGFRVSSAMDGREALTKVQAEDFDLILLDLMLPEIDGLTVCKEIRRHRKVPIIMLTAKSDDVDKILGLELGADDYITKPFNTRELQARVKAVLRRAQDWSQPDAPQQIAVRDLVLYPLQRRVERGGARVGLTPREYDMLEILARHPGMVYTRQQLLDLVWGYDFHGDDRTVDVHIRRLREKLEPNPEEPRYLRTRRGIGYFLEPQP